MPAQKRPFNEGKRHFKKNKKQKKGASDGQITGSNEEVLLADVQRLLKDAQQSSEEEVPSLPEPFTEIELDIEELSSTGDGLARKNGQVYVVPFTAPGDRVAAKVIRHLREEGYTVADFVKVVKASGHRTGTPKCPYFSKCSGCQFQHLPYTFQLAHKRSIVEKAYQNFSKLPKDRVPVVEETCGSPLQYGYRTKLTPHFDGPPGGRRDRRNGEKPSWPEVPPIGFMLKGTRKTLDIEDCPIGTDAVRAGLKREKKRVAENINDYQRGATVLLRETTKRIAKEDEAAKQRTPDELQDPVIEHLGEHLHRKTCLTDHKATSTEYIDDYRLDNPAGAFFQNNNSILPLVTGYIRDRILGPSSTSTSTSTPKIKNMIDAYCGSGFFTITLSPAFTQSIGIDISSQSIDFAAHNARLNNLAPSSTHFIAADANALFGAVDGSKYPPDETVVVIDPPRKGCDEGFIRQLMRYRPARVCYVSCNVHTQARDVGMLVAGFGQGEGRQEGGYEIESLRGFDFFPQTGHVEGVAMLRRKEGAGSGESGAGAVGKGAELKVDGQKVEEPKQDGQTQVEQKQDEQKQKQDEQKQNEQKQDEQKQDEQKQV
ncbi:hypothetical protein MBLNU230_g1811t1 [Neophaeotheca triangularis]